MALIPLLLTVHLASSPPKLGGDQCACDKAKMVNGWCDKCQVGYVAGQKMKSAMLFEVLDAHGHDIKPETIECPSCQKALASDGFCKRCRMGYVDEQLYFSKLTYLIAKGKFTDPSRLSCKVCRRGLERPLWCKSCRRGMLGHVEYKEKEVFAQAVQQFQRLRKAIQTSERCEQCAARIFTNGTCSRCHITYKDGEIVSKPPKD